MVERIKTIIKPITFIFALSFFICCVIKTPITIGDIVDYTSYSTAFVSILFIVYVNFLWRFIPWNRPPVLKSKYEGRIYYVFKKKPEIKNIFITIRQTWLSIEVETKTDINESYTVTGSIVSEHGKKVLYYTYVTNPNAANLKNNPIQYGTCRMILNEENKKLSGKYWTTSKTTGDIEWEEMIEDKQ